MSREDIMDSIKIGMIPDQDFLIEIFKQDAGYKGFADQALNKFNGCGCSQVWELYEEAVFNYMTEIREAKG